jgi:hypothetical protein
MDKISKDKQYTTRDGSEVRIYATDGSGLRPVQGAIMEDDGWCLVQWMPDGKRFNSFDSSSDLIEVKPRMKFERWALVERDGNYSLWLDKPSKASSVDAFGITQIVFEVEEGEGLEHGSN